MYIGFIHLHSALRWLVLILLFIAVAKAILGIIQKSSFSSTDNRVGIFLLATAHLQLLVGLGLYFISPIVTAARADMGAAMKDDNLRYWAVEHVFIMVIAIVLITMGRILGKRSTTDGGKHIRSFIFYVLALVSILYAIPWAERGWF